MAYIAEGMSNAEISNELGISEKQLKPRKQYFT